MLFRRPKMHAYFICYIDLCDTPGVIVFGDKILYHLICEMRTIADNATVAERIRFYRTKRGVFGDTLAEMIGMSRYAIMDYENGRSEPSLADLKKMAVALEIEEDKLFDDYYSFLNYPYFVKIKEMRKRHKLKQHQLAEMMGVSIHAIKGWEQSRHVIGRKSWEQLMVLRL